LISWKEQALNTTLTKELHGFAEGIVRNWPEVKAAMLGIITTRNFDFSALGTGISTLTSVAGATSDTSPLSQMPS